MNEFCRDIPFSMDNVARVADVAWGGVYFFKIDHKNGYHHVPIHPDSWKFLGCSGRVSSMFLLYSHLDGNLVLTFVILSQRLWPCIAGP